jgi:hypothetical protein
MRRRHDTEPELTENTGEKIRLGRIKGKEEGCGGDKQTLAVPIQSDAN